MDKVIQYSVDELSEILTEWNKNLDDFIFNETVEFLDIDNVGDALVSPYGYIVTDGISKDFVIRIVSGKNQGKFVKVPFENVYSRKFDVAFLPISIYDVFKVSVDAGIIDFVIDVGVMRKDVVARSYDSATDLVRVELVNHPKKAYKSVEVLDNKFHFKESLLENLRSVEDNKIIAVRVEDDKIIQQAIIHVLDVK